MPEAMKVVALEEAVERLRPAVRALKATISKMEQPDDFLICPLLMADMLYDMTDGDTDAARDTLNQLTELVINSYLVMKVQKRAESTTIDIVRH